MFGRYSKMDAPIKNKLLRVALLSRASVFVLQVVFNLLIPDHNADVFNPPNDNHKENVIDTVVHIMFDGFIRWDGVYFLHISEYGYIYENSLAFFPLFPWSIRILANSIFWPFQFVMAYRTVLILSGVILNFILHIETTFILFRLSKMILNCNVKAYYSTILFNMNPASIFMSALYSETMFSYLTFSSLLMFEEKKKIPYLLLSSLSCVTRSNGLLTAGYELHKTCQNITHCMLHKNVGFINRFTFILKQIMKLTIFLLLFLLPFIIYQFYIGDIFCNKKWTWAIPEFLIQYGQQRNYNLVTDSSFDWCRGKISFAYSHVQNSHWNVGFLRYYEIKQIPNFILAFPVSLLSILAVLYYYRLNRWTFLTLGLIPENELQGHSGFRNRQMLPYIAYLLFVTIFGWLFIHIQVLTRMLFSSSPVLYWIAAEVVSTQTLRGKNTTKQSNIACDIVNKIVHFNILKFRTKMVILYFLGYFVIGTIMFSNFLPWT